MFEITPAVPTPTDVFHGKVLTYIANAA